jgi:hypothetical protein
MAAEDPNANTETHAPPIKAARQSGKKPSSKAAGSTSKASEKLARLGLRRDMDFVLHLPMRYEDETAIIPMHDAALRGGSTVQVEGVVTASDVQYRPRRQLVVTISDDSGQIVLRFLNFYGSQLKQLAMGVRVRHAANCGMVFLARKWCTPATKSSMKARLTNLPDPGLPFRRRRTAGTVTQSDCERHDQSQLARHLIASTFSGLRFYRDSRQAYALCTIRRRMSISTV